jgi:hypothetical protein
MLKLNASYSKKVPAETEYSSLSYHAQVEVELDGGLSDPKLNEKIHNVFELVRNSVESEIQAAQARLATATLPAAPLQPVPLPPVPSQQQQIAEPVQTYGNSQGTVPAQTRRKRSDNGPATSKQIHYLMSLVKRAGWTVQQLLQHCQVNAVEQIPCKLCSQLIEQFSGQAA